MTCRRPRMKGKDPAAVALGWKGGKARAEAVSAKRRAEIARKAARLGGRTAGRRQTETRPASERA
jgi:hypothetical protein